MRSDFASRHADCVSILPIHDETQAHLAAYADALCLLDGTRNLLCACIEIRVLSSVGGGMVLFIDSDDDA
jgi:hypothetical protein